jgi:2-amino-4-hydroxy-6-hydroxymethyldihydropteridine diphosphokinase
MPTLYLALGTNLGDRADNLRRALAALPPAFRVQAISPVYETEPMYVAAQPNFLNLVARAQTGLLPHEALNALKLLENSLGRQASFRFGPRLIDLDILFYENIVLDSPDLTLPHPRLQERAFVLIPLNDIAPDLIHPKLKVPVKQLLTQLAEAERQKVSRLGEGITFA